MTKYSDRSYMDDTEMQSDMAEGSASWADGDNADDFPEASGSGSGPGKRRETRVPRRVICKVQDSNLAVSLFSIFVPLNSSHGNSHYSAGQESTRLEQPDCSESRGQQ